MRGEILYEVLLHVPASKLPTTLEVLSSVTLVYVRPTKESAQETPLTRTEPAWKYAGGKKNKGISSEELVLESVNSDPKRTWSSNELAEIFVARGFAANSCTAAASKLVVSGAIRRVQPGLFAPIGLVVHKGAASDK